MYFEVGFYLLLTLLSFMRNLVEQTDSNFYLLYRSIYPQTEASQSATCLSSACIDTTSRAERPGWWLLSLHHWVLEENCQEKPAWDWGWWEQSQQGFLDAWQTFHFCITLSLLFAASLMIVSPLCHSSTDLFLSLLSPFLFRVILISQFSFCLSDFLLIQLITKERQRRPVEKTF